MNHPLPLETVFLQLARDGLPLSVRDLSDALNALQLGFGRGGRDDLQWLCRTLWARTDEEHRRIRILFRDLLPPPTAEQVAAFTGERAAEPSKSHPAPAREKPAESPAPAAGSIPAIEIAAPDAAGGIGLPKATVPVYARESVILTPRPLVPLRGCVIAWRRFRRALRSGAKVELDMEQTIRQKARTGILGEPVMVAPRRNEARLVLLLDAGPAMAAWRHSTQILRDSLAESRLNTFGVFYFHETPERLFEKEGLTSPVPLKDALDRFADTPVLIVSDAGAARGGSGAQRIRKTREAITQFAPAWRPVAWINPMPNTRWRATAAASIARLPGIAMIPYNADGLVQAVDILRGLRQA